MAKKSKPKPSKPLNKALPARPGKGPKTRDY